MTRRNQGDRVRRDRPGQLAIVGATDGTAYTYAELDAAMTSAAAFVSSRIRPGETVGILGDNSVLWIIAFYAIQRAGGVPVPISSRLPDAGVRYVCEDAGLAFAFADDRWAAALTAAGVDVVPLPLLGTLSPTEFATVEPDAGALGMILYTSGTTGRPKGVELTQESHLWVIDQTAEDLPEGTNVTLISAPLYHMNALTNTQRVLASGGTVVLLPRFDPISFLTAIERYRVTDLSGVPPMFAMLGAHTERIAATDVSSVRRISMGSAPTPEALFRSLGEWFPGASVAIGYGTTESGPVAFAPHPDGRPTPQGSVGVAHPAVSLRLVDAGGREQSTEGVLEIRSPAILAGYRNRPDVPLPLTPDGFHHTKDVFRRDADGFYFFVGREDDMFVSGGENVFPRAVEQVLESHPAVSQAVVVPVPDEIKGAKPVAFVTIRAGEHVDEDELRSYVLERLEPFAHPRRIWFVDEIPLSATNKVDRAALTARALSQSGAAR